MLTLLSRLKDPSYNQILKDITNSTDPFLSVMAAYALGESGDQSGFRFLEEIVQRFSDTFPFAKELPELKLLDEVLRLPDILNETLHLYNWSYFNEARSKLLHILDVYSSEIPRMNIPHFDALVAFSVRKTRGFLLDALAVCEFGLGNIEAALDYSLKAVDLAREVVDPQLLKLAYADQSVIQISLGNYYSALELLHKSLEIDRGSHDPWRKRNRTISNLALLYYHIGQATKALEYSREALGLSKKENDLSGTIRCLNTTGVLLCHVNEFRDAADTLQEALDLSRNELQNRSLESLILNNLAYLHYSMSESEKAGEYLSLALDLALQGSDKSMEGTIMSNLALVELEGGNLDKARESAEAALAISKVVADRAGQVDANYLLGSIEDCGYDNPLRAYQYYQEAIGISETLRQNLLLDDFKISFADNQVALYQQMVSLCILIGKTAEAFEYIERSKSRALVDMLSSTLDTIHSKSASPEDLEKIIYLKGKLEHFRKQLGKSHLDTDTESSNERMGIEGEISELEKNYKKTFEELKLQDPEWASLVSIAPVTIEALQNSIDERTVVLEFYQTEETLIIIVISKSCPPSFVSISVDFQAESENLQNLLFNLSNREINTKSHEYIKTIKQPLSSYYELIIAPVVELLEGIDHLVIIPHLFWHYLPFHALYDKESKEFLVDKFSISYTPSATTLDLCGRKNDKHYETALILANPSGDLLYAEEEADKIAMNFRSRVLLFKRDQATWQNLSESCEADIIHLACHGYFRGDEPLFSHLVLADAEGSASPLFLADIFNLKLKTSLVTLSGCETGLNQSTPGDELIGMTRAFFYAGAPTLLASLWTVNDKSTSILMDKFYEGLITLVCDKANSLKSAICHLKAIAEYSHPYFWAPFFLSGDWR